MTITTLKDHIKTKKFSNLYIFTGPEVKVRDIYIEKIADTLNSDVVILEDMKELSQSIYKPTLINSENKAKLSVLFYCNELILHSDQNALISQIFAQKSKIYILVFSEIDKRTKFYQTYADYIVDFQPLKEDVLIRYIQKDLKISDKFASQLAIANGCSYSRILLEIDKVLSYKKSRGCTDTEAFVTLRDSGCLTSDPRDVIFDLVDAMLSRKRTLSLALLEECLESGEPLLVILTNLYNNVKRVLQVQSYDGDNIINASGLTAFQVKTTQKFCGKFSNRTLVELLKVLTMIEQGVKSGMMDEDFATDYLIYGWYAV